MKSISYFLYILHLVPGTTSLCHTGPTHLVGPTTSTNSGDIHGDGLLLQQCCNHKTLSNQSSAIATALSGAMSPAHQG